MIYESEFRRVRFFSNINDVLRLLLPRQPDRKYIYHYWKHFRYDECKVEHKQKLKDYAIFCCGLWFKLSISKEIPFKEWTQTLHRRFYYLLAYDLKCYSYEIRYEFNIDSLCKIVAFQKNNNKCGLLFELEFPTQTIPLTRRDVCKFRKSLKQCVLKHKLFPILKMGEVGLTKKSLTFKRNTFTNYYGSWHRNPNWMYCLKYTGICGWIRSDDGETIEEHWENNVMQTVIAPQSVETNVMFVAELLPDEKRILMDVFCVEDSLVYRGHMKWILLEYFEFLKRKVIHPYYVQNYSMEPMFVDDIQGPSEGLLAVSNENKLFKLKYEQTIDLVYEHGCFVLPNGKRIPTNNKRLKNGIVYECNLKFQVIQARADRFTSNSLRILKCLGVVSDD